MFKGRANSGSAPEGRQRAGMRRRADEAEAAPDSAASERFTVIESCHSTWLFDTEDQRFCRILKGVGRSVATEWRRYHQLLLDPHSDAFLVFLDASRTRLLRSWRHTTRCVECGGDVTAELSLAELRQLAQGAA